LVLMLVYASRGTSTATPSGTSVATVTLPTDMQDMLVSTQLTVPATRSEFVSMVTESDSN
jgi:hypothetical protein